MRVAFDSSRLSSERIHHGADIFATGLFGEMKVTCNRRLNSACGIRREISDLVLCAPL